MHIYRLPPTALVDSSEEEDDDNDDESSLDEETKRNSHILAQWDESFDELDQNDDDDESEGIEAQWRDAKAIVEEEEEDILFDDNILTCPNVSRRSNGSSSSRPTKRVDLYHCKSCGRGMRRTTRYVYEED